MTQPFVGLPSTVTDGECGYAADIDTPTCGQPATTHVIGRSAAWGWVGLPTCDAHLSLAIASCVEIDETHPAAGCNGEHFEPVGGAR